MIKKGAIVDLVKDHSSYLEASHGLSKWHPYFGAARLFQARQIYSEVIIRRD
jgi:hypothetical protein